MRNEASRYRVHDRGATTDTRLHRFSYVNPRYYVLAPDGEVVDELTTKREAQAIAAQLNRDAR